MNETTWEALRALDSPTIANAIETFGVRPHTAGYTGPEISCLFPGLGTLLGFACTAAMAPREVDEADYRRVYLEFCSQVERVPHPSVAVIQDSPSDPFQAALVGEVMATVLMRLGAVGCVSNGAVRDLEQMELLGFQVHAAGVIVSHGQMKFAASGIPVQLGRLTIRPGDLIHADRNGVVVIPAEIAPEVPAAASRILEDEQRIMQATRRPDFTAAALEEFYR